jgi:UDP-3-O-[3-hydroxymyristoyl] glucosamine N-acyltransferase
MPIVPSTAEYNILFDQNKPLCFVGSTYYNKILHDYFSKTHDCQLVRVEDIENNTQDWFDQHQFISVSSNPQTKYFITNKLASKNPHYFSIVGNNNQFNDLKIGNGTFIEFYNTAQWPNITVGNHCTIGSYIQLGHDTTINDYCQVGGYSFINFTALGEGNCVGIRSSMLGKPDHILSIVKHCNFMTGSMVTKDIDEPGKYFGNRRISDETSLVYSML